MTAAGLRLRRLAGRARACRRCPGVRPGSAVLGARNGPVPAPLLFVAEAPGYLGGVRTGVPLLGDRSGANFRYYCAEAGIDLRHAFVCNAVLCHPPSAEGRNRTPRAGEVAACGDFLGAIVDLVAPLLVVALGRVALVALGRLAPHDLALGPDNGRVVAWRGRRLMSLYHPSGQTLGRRARAQQVDDYRAIAHRLRGIEGALASGLERGRREVDCGREFDCSTGGPSIS